MADGAGLITVVDAHPATLSWLASVRRHRVIPLGVDRFGQSGDLPDLYREYRLDVDAIVDAVARVALSAPRVIRYKPILFCKPRVHSFPPTIDAFFWSSCSSSLG